MKLLYMAMFFIILVSCSPSKDSIPEYISTNVLIPTKAKNVKYVKLDNSYQIYYDIDVKFPSKNFIENLIQFMSDKKWIRQQTDFNDSSIKLNHAINPPLWSHFYITNEKEKYQWIEDWKDKKGNVIRYGLTYLNDMNQDINKNRNLNLVVIIIEGR